MYHYAELGACMGNSCFHVCGIGYMFAELNAYLGNGPWLACGVGCLSGDQGAFPSSQAGPGPGSGPLPPKC